MAEGFLDIIGIEPDRAHTGETVDLIIHTKNTGAKDDFKVELIGDLTGSQEFPLRSGKTIDVIFSFTMPNNDISITINTYHYEIIGWVWDTSSVWELLFPFMNIHALPYKQ